jgi:transcription antitermination factor NusG
MRIGYFLPLVHSRRRLRGRTIERHLPLFPSYLFLCGSEEDRYATLMTHRVANVITVVNQEQLKSELRQIEHIILSEQPVDLFPGLKCGRRCRVVSGALAGIEGIVLRRRGVCRVYVGVEVLGQSAELEIDPAQLEVIE